MRIREACGDEERLDQLIADYLRAVPGGHAPDRRQLIEAHPDLAEELSSFFAARDAFQRFVDHLRRHRDRLISSPPAWKPDALAREPLA